MTKFTACDGFTFFRAQASSNNKTVGFILWTEWQSVLLLAWQTTPFKLEQATVG
jgi:hypothetical protein